jgi:hypothetical protein
VSFSTRQYQSPAQLRPAEDGKPTACAPSLEATPAEDEVTAADTPDVTEVPEPAAEATSATVNAQSPVNAQSLTDSDEPPETPPSAAVDQPAAGGGKRRHPVLGGVLTAFALVFVVLALITPNRLDKLSVEGLVRIPVEALLGVVIVLLLPERLRKIVAATAGLVLGLLTILKFVDMGFYGALDRPFDPVLDATFLRDGVEFVDQSYGKTIAIVAVIVAILVVLAVPVLMTLSVLRLTRLVSRHRAATVRTVGIFALAWVICFASGAQLVPGVPIASRSAASLAYHHAIAEKSALKDGDAFAAAAANDKFSGTPANQLLTGLRGKDVLLTFVESYGVAAIKDPEISPAINAELADGDKKLAAVGFSSRSAYLTSPTFGGGSWLAHSTMQSGVWIDNEDRYNNLTKSTRFTLTGAFDKAGWRTVGVMPGVTRDWPEGRFYGYKRVYDSKALGYQGPGFNLGAEPDQYTLSVMQRSEFAQPDRTPVMAEIDLITSHAPWTKVPKLINWNTVGDGSVYAGMAKAGDPTQTRTEYQKTIEYSLASLISYVTTYGNDNLVLVFLGDHQPATVVSGQNASRNVPVTIVAHDQSVLDKVSGWGWTTGLKPGAAAPVWKMDAFRDKFLGTFSS